MTPSLRISALCGALAWLLAGCDAPAPGPGSVSLNQLVTATYFSEKPLLLDSAAREACSAPNEKYARPRPGVVQCRFLLDPELTAAVILQFDGDINDLPQLVVSLYTARAGDGYLVTGCTFLKVPRKTGALARVVQYDRAIMAKLQEMLQAGGGKPVRDVPMEAAESCFSL